MLQLEHIKQKVTMAPQAPGCYIWLRARHTEKDDLQLKPEQVLYVGKANSIRARLRQYLQAINTKDTDQYKTGFLMQEAMDVIWIITSSEDEALLLENNLIKKYNPVYNVRLKDDKRYPFLCLTLSEPFPRLVISRKKSNPANKYFGPYSDVRSARDGKRLLEKIFPIRKRPLKLPLKYKGKPCLNFHIGRCWAPCSGDISKEDYAEIVRQVENFLENDDQKISEELNTSMRRHAENMEFEKAGRLRDLLAALDKVRNQNQSVHQEEEDLNADLVAVYTTTLGQIHGELNIDSSHLQFVDAPEETVHGQIVILKVRNGNLINKQSFAMTDAVVGSAAKSHLRQAQAYLEGFFRDYYLQSGDIPPLVYYSFSNSYQKLLSAKTWQKLFFDKLHQKMSIKLVHANLKKARLEGDPDPGSAEKFIKNILDLTAMAKTNAYHSLCERLVAEKIRNQKLGLRQIKAFLKLKKIPETIECYDISNLSGKNAVASGIMLKNGIPHKAGYRRYRIKMLNEPNDPAMMAEVISRRMARFANGDAAVPDLIIVDGGITQLNAALQQRDQFNIDVPIVGLAKKREEIYLSNEQILSIDPNSPGMLIFRLARDEAHRFGVSYHRKVRELNSEY